MARNGPDNDHVEGALRALTEMYDHRPPQNLSPRSRQAIEGFLHDAWTLDPFRVPPAALADLSLATGERQLHATVTRLVANPSLLEPKIAGTRLLANVVVEDLKRIVRRRAGPRLSDLAALRSGNDELVQQAIDHVRSIPAADRSTAILTAVSGAFLRHERQFRAVVGNPDPEDNLGHALVEALAQSRDPLVIPVLVASLGNLGGGAPEALARFGDQSIGPLIRVAQDPQSDRTSLRLGTLLALAWILEHPSDDPVFPLSEMGRQQIVSFARHVWQHPRLTADAIGLATLALATGDSTLRGRLEALATDPAALRAAGVTDQRSLRAIQSGLQYELKQHPAR